MPARRIPLDRDPALPPLSGGGNTPVAPLVSQGWHVALPEGKKTFLTV